MHSDELDPDRLAAMFAAQRSLQLKHNGYEIEEQDDETRIENVRINVLAAIKELTEVLDECGWKPWARSRHFNSESMRKELIDVWCFVMNLMLHAGMDPDILDELYAEKFEINMDRARHGYDGFRPVSVNAPEHCPACRRRLAAAELREIYAHSSKRVDIHCACGYFLYSLPV